MAEDVVVSIHSKEFWPHQQDFVVGDGVLYPVVWDEDSSSYLPFDWEEFNRAEQEITKLMGLPIKDGGVEGDDIDAVVME